MGEAAAVEEVSCPDEGVFVKNGVRSEPVAEKEELCGKANFGLSLMTGSGTGLVLGLGAVFGLGGGAGFLLSSFEGLNIAATDLAASIADGDDDNRGALLSPSLFSLTATLSLF